MLLQAKSECLSPRNMVSNLLVFQRELLQSHLPLSDASLLVVDLPRPLTLMKRQYSLLLYFLQHILHLTLRNKGLHS